MHPLIDESTKTHFYQRFRSLYGKQADHCFRRLVYLLGRYGVGMRNDPGTREGDRFDEQDAVLITYGDMIYDGEDYKLADLCKFLNEYVEESVSVLHILPFFPYSSDEGFSVKEYRKVREDLGDWNSIQAITTRFDEHIQQYTAYEGDYVTNQLMQANYDVMADLVINHVSRESAWFQDFLSGIQPAKNYFITVDPETDLSMVTRPRSTPLLTPVRNREGKVYVWTTFSNDQIDLDFSNPDVLFEILDILLFYISKGISVIRLDAIAYLWKEIGTNCIHLPETHEIVKLIREFVEVVAPHVTIITETNVPHEENISYFGDGDEAHMVYQFSLPPLLLHAILSENASYLTEWAKTLDDPPENCLYFNFTASHDGIGVRPLEGLVPQEEFDRLVESTRKRGGYVSYKTDEDGNESPYELNITYFDAFKDIQNEDPGLQIRRFMCSQIIMLSLKGLPGIYLHSLTATSNYAEGVEQEDDKRAINRKRWGLQELKSRLEDEASTTAQVFYRYRSLLNIRRQHPAFHPHGDQTVYEWEDELFVIFRESPDSSDAVLSVSNCTSDRQKVDIRDAKGPLDSYESYPNLLEEESIRLEGHNLILDPYETVWLKVR